MVSVVIFSTHVVWSEKKISCFYELHCRLYQHIARDEKCVCSSAALYNNYVHYCNNNPPSVSQLVFRKAVTNVYGVKTKTECVGGVRRYVYEWLRYDETSQTINPDISGSDIPPDWNVIEKSIYMSAMRLVYLRTHWKSSRKLRYMTLSMWIYMGNGSIPTKLIGTPSNLRHGCLTITAYLNVVDNTKVCMVCPYSGGCNQYAVEGGGGLENQRLTFMSPIIACTIPGKYMCSLSELQTQMQQWLFLRISTWGKSPLIFRKRMTQRLIFLMITMCIQIC